MEKNNIRKAVRESYARIAKRGNSCCAPVSSCCESPDLTEEVSKKIGYTEKDLKSIPEGSNLGLGCGNPVAIASLKEGETVLDLGAGAGFDCFLAANKVGQKGRVIGVDMTPEMVEKARENAERGGYDNVEFRLGEIENLPVADVSVDVIISNCVINLAPDKRRVFDEAFRTLKPGGRLMISDIVLLKELPEVIKKSVEAYVGCVSGAVLKDEYIKGLKEAGFQDVRIEDETSFPVESVIHDPATREFIDKFNIPLEKVEEVVASIQSIKVSGVKPGS
ncbi:MAG: arsenite methyltransferase [Candidatus Aminicenantes bacterium]|nr:arsenite methyltransferase [Candidatus Aminicenantes bacterium]